MAVFNLLRYRQLLAKTDSLTSKNDYFILIQKYLNEIINSYIFRAEFIKMVNEDLKKSQEILDNFEELSTFWIDLELDEFGSLFENIHETCLCAFEFEGQEDAMPETKFRDSIQKIFFKIQKYLD